MNQLPDFWKEYPDIRFCRVRAGTKRPFEDEWNSKEVAHTAESIKPHFESGESYGAMGGYGGLVIIDADEPGVYESVVDLLPPTLTVKTAKGHHSYFFCEELKKKIVMIDENKKHWGEIQSWGSQCIAPGCTHETGVKYEPLPVEGTIAAEEGAELTYPKIATISHEQLATFAKPFSKKVQRDFFFGTDKESDSPAPKVKDKAVKVEKQLFTEEGNNYDFTEVDTDNIGITDVWNIAGWEKVGGDYLGPHPVHGSTGGKNLSINPGSDVWHCYRCGSGGDPMMALAVQHGIIDCSDAEPGVLDDNDLFQQTISVARSEGLGTPAQPFEAKSFADILDKPTAPKKKAIQEEVLNARMYKDFKNLVQDDSFFVKDFILPKTLTMLYSPPGQFKSILSLYLALCIADGRPWLDLETEKNPVLYLDAENPDQTVKARLEGMFSAHQFQDEDLPFYQVSGGRIMDGKKNLNVAWLRGLQRLIHEKNIKIIFIDTLHRFCGYDENSADDINKLYMDFFQPLIDMFGVSIVFLHHSSKAGGYRGSGDFLGMVDTAYQVQKLAGIDGAAVRGFSMKNEKNRSGEQEMITGEIEFGKHEDGADTIEIRRRIAKKTEEQSKDEIGHFQKDQILECFHEGTLYKKAQIVAALEANDVEIPPTTLKRRMAELVSENKIVYNDKNKTYEIFVYGNMGQKKL